MNDFLTIGQGFGPGFLNIGGPGIQMCAPRSSLDLTPYNLYFTASRGELITSQSLDGTGLVSGRKGYDGGTFEAGEPVVESDGVLLCEQYTNEILWSEDLTDAVWVPTRIAKTANTVLNDATPDSSHSFFQLIPTIVDNADYCVSCIVTKIDYDWVRLLVLAKDGSTSISFFQIDEGQIVKILNSLSGGSTPFVRFYNAEADGKTDIDGNAEGLGSQYSNFQVTQSPYALPYVKTESTAVTVPENFSDVDRGPRLEIKGGILDALDGVADGVELWDGTDVGPASSHFVSPMGLTLGEKYEIGGTLTGYDAGIVYLVDAGSAYTGFPENVALSVDGRGLSRQVADATTGLKVRNDSSGVVSEISCKQVSPAQGKLTLNWTPMFTAGDLTGNINIIAVNDSITDLLYFDATNNLIKSTDGTNTVEIACSPVSGTTYEIVLDYAGSTSEMRLSLDGTPGTAGSFAGRFPYSTHLNFGYQAAAPQYIGDFNIAKESGL